MAGVESSEAMGEITVTAEIRALLDQLRKANQRAPDPIAITRLRTQFNDALARLESTIGSSEKAEANLRQIRSVTSFHQLKWGTCRMLEDVDRYRADSRRIGTTVRECLDLIDQGSAASGTTE